MKTNRDVEVGEQKGDSSSQPWHSPTEHILTAHQHQTRPLCPWRSRQKQDHTIVMSKLRQNHEHCPDHKIPDIFLLQPTRVTAAPLPITAIA